MRQLLLCLALLALRASAADTPSHDFAKWEKEIAAYEHADATNPPPKRACLFIGSSTIRLWSSLSRDFPRHSVINRGFGGSEIVDSTYFADRLIFPHTPRMVLLRAGGNDLWAGKSPEIVFADFTNFVAKVQSRLPECDIVFVSLSPSIARWKQAAKEKEVNRQIEDFVRGKPRLQFLDVYDLTLDASGQARPELFIEDKLHFNAAGYRLLAERVRKILPEPE